MLVRGFLRRQGGRFWAIRGHQSRWGCVLHGCRLPIGGVLGAALGIDGNNDALITEAGGGFFDQGGVVDGSGVEADFVGSGVEHITNIAFARRPAVSGMKHSRRCVRRRRA